MIFVFDGRRVGSWLLGWILRWIKKPMQRHRLELPALRLELRHARAQKILSLSCLPFHQAGKY